MTVTESTPAESTEGAKRAHSEMVLAVLEKLFGELPEIVNTPQPSLMDLLRHSRKGDWTTAKDGAARFWHLIYTWVVALPIAAVAYMLMWIVRYPQRFAVCTPIVLALGTLLALVPKVGWFVPSVFDVLSWF